MLKCCCMCMTDVQSYDVQLNEWNAEMILARMKQKSFFRMFQEICTEPESNFHHDTLNFEFETIIMRLRTPDAKQRNRCERTNLKLSKSVRNSYQYDSIKFIHFLYVCVPNQYNIRFSSKIMIIYSIWKLAIK